MARAPAQKKRYIIKNRNKFHANLDFYPPLKATATTVYFFFFFYIKVGWKLELRKTMFYEVGRNLITYKWLSRVQIVYCYIETQSGRYKKKNKRMGRKLKGFPFSCQKIEMDYAVSLSICCRSCRKGGEPWVMDAPKDWSKGPLLGARGVLCGAKGR